MEPSVDIADTVDLRQSETVIDFERFRLRRFVENLESESLEIRDQPIDQRPSQRGRGVQG